MSTDKNKSAAHLERQRPCPHCRKRRKMKDSADVPFRTLFGVIPVPNPRWYHCDCQENDRCDDNNHSDCQTQKRRTFRPMSALLPERSSPELLYLETKWASLASYGLTSELLCEVLPIDHKHNHRHSPATVRNHLLRMAERSEKAMGAEKAIFLEGCQADRDRLPTPDGPLSVGLDGGIVRARRKSELRRSRAARHLKDCVGKPPQGSGRRDGHQDQTNKVTEQAPRH